MSPWARASPIRTLVTADCSCMTPPSSSGTPSMLTPSSVASASSSTGVSQAASASWAAGRTLSAAKARPPSWNICCSSSGPRSNRPFDLPFFWRAGLPSCCAALKVRPAAVAVWKPPLVPWKRARSTCLRIRIRSSRSEPARRLSCRRPKPMPRSATLALFSLSVVVVTWLPPGFGFGVGLERRHAAVEMRGLPLRVAHGEGDLVALGGAGELDAGGQQDRLAEAHVDGEGVGQAAVERRQAAGLGPHPVRDRPREAERLRGQRVHVDRVAVAGDGGVAAAEVAAELPLGAGRGVVGGRAAAKPLVARRLSPSAARRACRGAASCWRSPRRARRRP